MPSCVFPSCLLVNKSTWNLFLAATLGLLGMACGGEAPLPPAMVGQMGGASPAEDDTCTEGANRECTITRELASGVVLCADGVKFCVDGAWSECFRTDSVAP